MLNTISFYFRRRRRSEQKDLALFSGGSKCLINNDKILNHYTLKCLSIGTPKTINFPFVSDEKLMIFRCSNIQAHYNAAVIYLNFGTPKNDEFSIWNKWKIYFFYVCKYLSTLG